MPVVADRLVKSTRGTEVLMYLQFSHSRQPINSNWATHLTEQLWLHSYPYFNSWITLLFNDSSNNNRLNQLCGPCFMPKSDILKHTKTFNNTNEVPEQSLQLRKIGINNIMITDVLKETTCWKLTPDYEYNIKISSKFKIQKGKFKL